MPELTYKAENFLPSWGQNFEGEHTICCSWEEIVWSAITVGKASWADVWKHGGYSLMEANFRLSMIYAYLKQNYSGNLIQSPVYATSDPSEKSAISYFHGLVFTKLLSEKLFGLTYLMHIDVYRRRYGLKFHGENRPDLIGFDLNGGWFVLEAKGRSGPYSKSTMEKAKKQVRSLRKINGKDPKLKAAVQSFYNSNDALQLRIMDPPEFDEGAVDIDINQSLIEYYRMIIELIDNNKQLLVNDKHSYVIRLDGVDVMIGLDKYIYNSMKNYGTVDFESMVNILSDIPAGRTDGYKGKDGIYIKCGEMWSEQQMRHDPHKRLEWE